MKKLIKEFVFLTVLISVLMGTSESVVLSINAAPQSSARYIVLVLDISGPETFIVSEPNVMNLWGEKYTSNSSIEDVKKAAEKFIEDASNSLEDNYIAIVGYDQNAKVYTDFTNDNIVLRSTLSSITCSGEEDRDIRNGLECAKELFAAVPNADAKKSILLCTTGLTDEGQYSYTGHYDDSVVGSTWQNEGTEIRLYAYANTAMSLADQLKIEDTTIYVVGIFDPIDSALTTDSTSEVKSLLHLIAHDLASSDNTFYDVDDPNNLKFVFEKVQNDLNGKTERLYNNAANYKTPKLDSKNEGQYYVDVWWGGSLFEVPSTEMYSLSLQDKDSVNWNLAMVAAELSAVAYSPDDLIKNYKTLGFDEKEIFLYSYPGNSRNQDGALRDGRKFADDGDLAFSIATRMMQINGVDTDLIIITAQGTHSTWEAVKDGTSFLANFHGLLAWDWPYEFEEDIFAGLQDFMSTHQYIGTRPMKILVTGHSLGGAAANLVAAELNIQTASESSFYRTSRNEKAYNLSAQDIYAYTFGAIDPLVGLTAEMNNRIVNMPIQKGFDNILNIYNLLDNFGPLLPYPVKPSGWTGKNRFGRCLYFANRMKEYVNAARNVFEMDKGSLWSRHEISGYLQAVENGLVQSEDKNVIRIVIRCPVDVAINHKGQMICEIKDNQVIEADENVVADVYEDVKTIILPDGPEYEVKLDATDTGSMTYSVQELTENASETVCFSDVELEKGKQMLNSLEREISSNELTLEVQGDISNQSESILPDNAGMEVAEPESFDINTDSEIEKWKDQQREKMIEELIPIEPKEDELDQEESDEADPNQEALDWETAEREDTDLEEAEKTQDQDGWICPECGYEAQGNFCSNCGSARNVGDETEEETISPEREERGSEYILEDADKRYLTEQDVVGLSAQALNYAKNELFARHGRKFASIELQQYFGSKSWYNGTIDPDAFSVAVFNEYERANVELLADREWAVAPGGYQLDQPGYDINAVGTGSRAQAGYMQPEGSAEPEPEPVANSRAAFFGIWCGASKDYNEAQSFANQMRSYGLSAEVLVTTDWSNLNTERWYVITAGMYDSESSAYAALGTVQLYYPDAYIKYSGNFQDESYYSTNEYNPQLTNNAPFFGIWCGASKDANEALDFANQMIGYGLPAEVFITTDWTNLNSEMWYVITAGVYLSEADANAALGWIRNYYPDAYVKYSGDYRN